MFLTHIKHGAVIAVA